MRERRAAIPASLKTADGKGLKLRAYMLLVLLCIGFFTPGIVTLPPIDRDEPHFAQASKQMIETGDYVDIRFQAAGRYKKPIGIYWLQAASVKLFDPDHLNEIWAYRLPSMLGATVAVLMTAALGTLLFNPTTGFLAGVMMAGCVLLNSEARIAKTDAVLLAAIMAAQYALARAYMGRCQGWLVPLAFWSALGVGFLVKGPIILLVLFSTLLWLWWNERDLSWFRALKPVWGIPYCLLVTAPWFIAIILASHGAFVQQSAGHDMMAKIWEGQDRGKLPPGVHLLIFPVMFFPFSLLAILAGPDSWANRRDRAVRFCLGWIIPTWLVFEASLTKLPHYVLPAYPAIALLTSKALLEGFPKIANSERRWPIALSVTIWLFIGIGFAVAPALLPYVIDQTWSMAQIACGFVLLLAQCVALLLLLQNSKAGCVIAMTVASFILIVITIGQTLPQLQHLWISNDIVRAAERVKPCEKLRLVTASYDEPSIVFLAGTDTILQLEGRYANAEMQKDRCLVAAIDNDGRLGSFLYGAEDPERNAKPVAEVRDYNLGNHNWRTINLYVMPPEPVLQTKPAVPAPAKKNHKSK